MEAELEEERKARASAQNAKKKLELDMKDMEEQLESASKVKEDGIRQLKKYQQQVKDIQRDLDEATSSRDQIAENARENEKKLKNLETEFLQMQEVRILHVVKVSFERFIFSIIFLGRILLLRNGLVRMLRMKEMN